MANVLVFIELSDAQPLPGSLEVLGQARRVATRLGATVYAVVVMAHAPRYDEDDLIMQLARRGADKVVVATDETLPLGGDLRWGTHGAALATVCDLLSPSLLLFSDVPAVREVAARAAARMGAAYLADAWIDEREQQLVLWQGSGAEAEALGSDLEFAVVATVPPGRYRPASGDDEAEVEIVAAGGRGRDFEELGWESDARPAVVIVAAAEQTQAAHELAAALGGVVASAAPTGVPTRLAVTLGPPCPPAERRVRLGNAAGDSEYALAGPDSSELARALARELARAGEGK
jgi:electron transfer flavoprotein alpha subunit